MFVTFVFNGKFESLNIPIYFYCIDVILYSCILLDTRYKYGPHSTKVYWIVVVKAFLSILPYI